MSLNKQLKIYIRSEVDWENEHTAGVVSVKAQNVGAA